MKAIKGVIVDLHGKPIASANYGGGGYTGAGGGFGNEIADWAPRAMSVDQALLPDLAAGNARSDDLSRNHGIANGAVEVTVDHVVGHLFKPSVKINWRRVGITEDQARDLAQVVEAAWQEYAEDDVNCFIDAERKRTFTMLIREGMATATTSGEILSSAEWIDRGAACPFKTAIKVINSNRLSNPGGAMDTDKMRGGIEADSYGAAEFYNIREPINTQFDLGVGGKWQRIPRQEKWGRLKILHIFEPRGDGQTRGINKFLSIMSRLKMLDKFQATQLQSAIIGATYAAVIESDLSSEDAFNVIGGDDGKEKLLEWMQIRGEYASGTNLTLNGAKITHLLPGEKLNVKNPGVTAAGYADFETAVLRNVASGLGVSYEQLSRDYSKVSYSSARASSNESHRGFMAKRKIIAGRYASMIYSLWFEEAFYKGIFNIPKGAVDFQEARAAWCNVKWIGAGRIGIDGLKEVKESVLKISEGLSTYEKECALLGEDYREMFDQQVREMKERKEAGLPVASWAATQVLAPDGADSNEEQTPAAPAAPAQKQG